MELIFKLKYTHRTHSYFSLKIRFPTFHSIYILEDASYYRKTTRLQRYLPTIVYLKWSKITLSKTNNGQSANRTRSNSKTTPLFQLPIRTTKSNKGDGSTTRLHTNSYDTIYGFYSLTSIGYQFEMNPLQYVLSVSALVLGFLVNPICCLANQSTMNAITDAYVGVNCILLWQECFYIWHFCM